MNDAISFTFSNQFMDAANPFTDTFSEQLTVSWNYTSGKNVIFKIDGKCKIF